MSDIGAESVLRTLGYRRGRSLPRFVVVLVAAFLVVPVAALGVRSCAGRRVAPAYETAVVGRTDLRVAVTVTGSLEATARVDVGAEVTGRVRDVLVDVNDAVSAGQVLAIIDPEQLRAADDEAAAQVASATAAIHQARATQVEAVKAARRARDQATRGLISDRDLEAATAQEQRAWASVESANASATLARAKAQQTKSQLAKTKIVSPIDGIVLARFVEPGQTVTSGFQTPLLFRLARDLTQMRLNVDVNEVDVGRVHPGAEATFTVEAYPERQFASRVLSLGNEPKTAQGVVSYQAVLSVDNGDRLLRPGMTCTATIIADTRKDAVVVPNAALRFTPSGRDPKSDANSTRGGVVGPAGRRRRIWTLRQGTATDVLVEAGATDGRVTEILGDTLAAGSVVIVDEKTSEP